MRKLKSLLKFLAIAVIAVIIFGIATDKLDLLNFNALERLDRADDYSSEYIYVLNREDKKTEFEKNAKVRAYPASLTKIMTTIVAIENIEDLSKVAPVDVDTYKEMVANNASMAGFYGRETVTYRDLLYGTVLSSGGEAANSLAINISGNVKDFVKLMNDKVSELGLKDTNFTNPEGLHNKDQYTTAYDMAKILDYALENGHFRAVFTRETFKTSSTLDHPDGINLRSTVLSRLDSISQEDFHITGGKSGTTSEAGKCWATVGTKNGNEYICIVMGAHIKDIGNSDGSHINDTIDIFKQIK